MILEANDRAVAYEHVESGLKSGLERTVFANIFLLQDGKWLKFDGKNEKQYIDFLDSRDTMLQTNDHRSECISQIDRSFIKFVNGLYKILRSEN